MQHLKRFFCLTVAVIILGSSSGYTAHARTDDKPDFKNEISGPVQEYVIFSDKNNIKTQDMRKKSQVSEEQLRVYLQRFPNLSGIEGALIEAQDIYNVNAILMLSIIRLESGNGKSNLARNQNNLGGITAPRNSVTAFRSFDSKRDCVIYMAKLLGEQYLNETGRFFNGYTLLDINKKYSASTAWSTKVSEIMYEIQWRLGW